MDELLPHAVERSRHHEDAGLAHQQSLTAGGDHRTPRATRAIGLDTQFAPAKQDERVGRLKQPEKGAGFHLPFVQHKPLRSSAVGSTAFQAPCRRRGPGRVPFKPVKKGAQGWKQAGIGTFDHPVLRAKGKAEPVHQPTSGKEWMKTVVIPGLGGLRTTSSPITIQQCTTPSGAFRPAASTPKCRAGRWPAL